jgi:hypothetical protein
MDPNVTDVLTDAAALLGDPTQEQFSNALLLPWYSFAYREVYDVCQRWRLPLAQRTEYMYLPAQQGVLIPAAIGFTDFGEPINLWERGNVSTLAVSTVSNATPVSVTTSTPHGLGTGQEVQLSGIVGPVGVNGQWFITNTGTNTFTLNGSVAGGAYVSGGTVVVGNDIFTPMTAVDELPDSQTLPTALRIYTWEKQRLYFTGATVPIELQVEYTASGDAPQTGTVGIDDSRNFLAQRTCSLIAPQYDMQPTADRALFEAFGPSKTADGSGGALRNCVGPMLTAKQNTVKRPQTFRTRRNWVTRTMY